MSNLALRHLTYSYAGDRRNGKMYAISMGGWILIPDGASVVPFPTATTIAGYSASHRINMCASLSLWWERSMQCSPCECVGNLGRILYNVGPLCTGLINVLCSHARFRHSCIFSLFRDQYKAIVLCWQLSSPIGMIICSFFNISNSSLNGSCGAYAICLAAFDMVCFPP